MEDVAYKKGRVGIEIIEAKKTIHSKVRNGKPEVVIGVRVTGNISDIETNDLDLTKSKTIHELENRVEQNIKRKIEQSIQKAQEELKVDIFGFGSTIERDEPEEWEKLERIWSKAFPDLSVQVHVEAKIKQIGTITNSILEDID
ncbi:Ger(x)C family spore germination C-terminal domain-containing protein [Ectobacillus funiculus]|uniref:Ger(X)C family spore germination C-terminal domain-containing protein n=1 Tax=Ectobacillus funiculus TaxID=137993 RepID=A0ABV5WI15_9BACI